MSTRNIHDQVKDIYGIELSAEMVSKITDSLLPEIKEWQNRPLEQIYPFVFKEYIHSSKLYRMESLGKKRFRKNILIGVHVFFLLLELILFHVLAVIQWNWLISLVLTKTYILIIYLLLDIIVLSNLICTMGVLS